MKTADGLQTTIGLEIHVQLNTKSKMFCGCDNNAEGKEPNSVTCPICMGMPGTLPVANKEAILKTLKIGLALGSEIPEVSKFDRKHYFYPDLPKGYQISQYDKPFCRNGKMELKVEGGKLKEIRINRVHLEEDAGKLVHPSGADFSFVDLNRAGTPLMEIVTEPDITGPAMAKEFMQELHSVCRALGVSDADMEKGQLRCDANISIKSKVKSQKSKREMSEIVEIKNLNSFKFVEKALAFEEKRLRGEYPDWPQAKTKVTRRFNSATGETFTMREKEEAKDYRYFPEPDLSAFNLQSAEYKAEIEKIKRSLPSLPSEMKNDLIAKGFSEVEAQIISKNLQLVARAEVISEKDPKNSVKIIRFLINNRGAMKLSDDSLVELGEMLARNLPSNLIRRNVEQAIDLGRPLSDISESSKTTKRMDIGKIIETVIEKNADAVVKYKSGKRQVLGFLVGEVMREAKGGADPNEIREKLVESIKSQ